MTAISLQQWIKLKGIGLTGGVATGKSTIANHLRNLGYQVLDADQIAREVVEPGQPAYHDILKQFGSDLAKPDRTLDRKKLGAEIWGVPAKKLLLEQITHPRIKDEFLRQVAGIREADENKFFFYEAALIFEVGRDQEFYAIVCAWCPEDIQIKRLVARNQINEGEARIIISSQMSAASKKEKSDFTVLTDCPEIELRTRVFDLIKLLS